MAMAKRALSDSLENLFITVSIWLFIKFLTGKKLFNFILFILFFIYSILIREQAILLAVFFVLYLLVYKYLYKEYFSDVYLPIIIIGPIFAVALIWIVFSNDFSNVISVISLNLVLPTLNEYSVLFCRGPWFRFVVDYLLISPLVTMLGISFLVYSLANRSILKDRRTVYFIILFISQLLLLNIFTYNKNIRYAMILDMSLRLFAVLMITEIFKKSKFSGDFVFIAVLFLCFVDYFSFIDIFCKKNIYDPVSFMLLKSKQFIP